MLLKQGNGYKNLTGMRFGRLRVLKDSGNREERRVVWDCLCDCGNTAMISSKKLLSGNTKSCGCYGNEVRGQTLRKDITGKRYGRLIVIKCVGKKNKRRQWLCKCDCGNMKITIGDNLTGKKVTSCGCYQLESRTGVNCHFWKGGISKLPYNTGWNGTLRNKIRMRDNFQCQLCHKPQTKEKLAVHHIDYDKQNINDYNLVSLCRSCHTKTNHLREKWIYPLQIKSGYWQCYE